MQVKLKLREGLVVLGVNDDGKISMDISSVGQASTNIVINREEAARIIKCLNILKS